MVGGCELSVQLTVREVEEELPHASVAVHVLVFDLLQVPVTDPSEEETDCGLVQLSVAEAVPNAALICASVGLQPRVPL